MKVLIADDSEEVRGLIRAILERQGHEVVGEAWDGASALKAFMELRPEVVLLDIIMPGRSGVDVLEDIRKADPEAKVVMVTAVEQNSINRRLMLIGAAGIIYKPFTPGDFERSFHAFMQKKPETSGAKSAIKRLAAGGLSKCMLKTAEASSWAWELCDVSVAAGKMPDVVKLADLGKDAAAVQINIRNGASLAAAMVFRSEDMGFISKCFVKSSLYRTEGVRDMEEGLLLEIGNIILNALASPLINALKISAIPSVPMLIKGGADAIAAGLGSCLDQKLEFRIISATLAMRREGRMARAGVVCILPEELAAEIERE